MTSIKKKYVKCAMIGLVVLAMKSKAGEPVDLPIDPVLGTGSINVIDVDSDCAPEMAYVVEVVPLESRRFNVQYSVAVSASSQLLRSTVSEIPSAKGQELGSRNPVHTRSNGALLLNYFREQEVFPFWFFTDFNSSVPEPFFTNKLEFIVGFRSDLEDGRHYGWIRFTREDTLFPRPFKLEAWDWNPVPDLPIRAGLPPEIPLSSELTRNEADEPVLRLSWPQAVLLWTLESTTNLVAPVRWETVPTGANWAEVPLTGEGEPERYFRLRKP